MLSTGRWSSITHRISKRLRARLRHNEDLMCSWHFRNGHNLEHVIPQLVDCPAPAFYKVARPKRPKGPTLWCGLVAAVVTAGCRREKLWELMYLTVGDKFWIPLTSPQKIWHFFCGQLLLRSFFFFQLRMKSSFWEMWVFLVPSSIHYQ